MITPERIEEIEETLVSGVGYDFHESSCPIKNYKNECDCMHGIARELLSELKDSLSREKKKREEVSRFASKLTEWIEEQIA